MQGIKAFFLGLPSGWRGGLLGGLVYFAWLALNWLVQANWPYHGRSFWAWVLVGMFRLPVTLAGYVSDALIDRALEALHGGSVHTTPYNLAGSLLLSVPFMLLGAILGLLFARSREDPKAAGWMAAIVAVLVGACILFSLCLTAMAFLSD